MSLTGITLGAALSLIVIGAAAAPVLAQSAASSIDQPTPATLPPGFPTDPNRDVAATDRANGRVAPPNAIQSTTDVMESSNSIQGRDGTHRTDPLQHLPKDMR